MEVAVVRPWESTRGRRSVWIERPDGSGLRIVPVAWTDIEPLAEPLVHDGRRVLLGPREALALAAWVESRRAGGGA